MSELKYVIIDNFWPIIFPTNINHCDIAIGKNITSAGFINERGEVYGFSDTLNLHSKESDQKLINRILIRKI